MNWELVVLVAILATVWGWRRELHRTRVQSRDEQRLANRALRNNLAAPEFDWDAWISMPESERSQAWANHVQRTWRARQ